MLLLLKWVVWLVAACVGCVFVARIIYAVLFHILAHRTAPRIYKICIVNCLCPSGGIIVAIIHTYAHVGKRLNDTTIE